MLLDAMSSLFIAANDSKRLLRVRDGGRHAPEAARAGIAGAEARGICSVQGKNLVHGSTSLLQQMIR